MKWVLAAALAAVLAVGTAAAEEKVLYCVDTDSNGFAWKNGQAQRNGFKPNRYVVKVHANGDRTISIQSTDHRFECSTSDLLGRITCIEAILRTELWAFLGNNYTRASVHGTPVGGDPNITVAYGTCTDF